MKKLNVVFAILITLISTTSCNKSDDDIPDIIITNISTDTANVGDIITINGQNFDTTQTYTVSFNGVEGTVTQTAANFIKVEIPATATSGDITIMYNGTTINAGTITIINIFTGDITLLTQQEVDDFGANNYTKVIGSVIIGSDTNPTPDSIENLDALATLTEVTETLGIYENTELSSINGLSNLISVGLNLVISYNEILSSLNGLNNLTSVGKNFQIDNNVALLNVDALSSLTSIGSQLTFSSDDNLTDISGLSNLTSLGGFSIDNTPIASISCLHNITTLTGSLSLMGISSLEGLNNITTIGEDLDLQHNSFTTLNALSNLTSIGGTFLLHNNNSLINFDGLTNLTSIGINLWVHSNTALADVDGLSSLASVGNQLHFDGNTSLTSFCGLNTLIIDNNFSNTYSVTGNAYNPTQQDIIDGNCSM